MWRVCFFYQLCKFIFKKIKKRKEIYFSKTKLFFIKNNFYKKIFISKKKEKEEKKEKKKKKKICDFLKSGIKIVNTHTKKCVC